jgi:ABC transporter DrrB family efflux protein
MAGSKKNGRKNLDANNSGNYNAASNLDGADAKRIKLAPANNGAAEKAFDIAKIFAIVKKNWMVLQRDTVRLFPQFFMPILMIIIFGYAAGNLPKHLPTAIVDYDHSQFSYSIIQQISAIEYFSVRYQLSTQDEGKKLLDEGKIKVLFILPEGLQEKVMQGQPAQISLMVDESDSSVAQAAKAAAQSFSNALSQSVSSQRLAAISKYATEAKSQLDKSRPLLISISSSDNAEKSRSSKVLADEAKSLASKYSSKLEGSILELQNSLGFLIDQNEVVDSFNPQSSMGKAALAKLSTGDSQASTLSQIAFYSSMQGVISRLGAYTTRLAADSQAIASASSAQSSLASISLSLQDSAGKQLEIISQNSQNVQSPVSLKILQPYGYGRRGIDFLLPAILALVIFQGASMGLGRAIAGERQDGSMTRVFLTPTSNVTIIIGTQLFYLLFETIRSSIIIFIAIALFGVTISGSLIDVIFIIALFSLGATGVGMVLSVIAKTQEQYVALAMLVSMPMIFLSGAFFPLQTMPQALQAVAKFLPVTYAADALRGVMVKGFGLLGVLPDIIVLAIFGAFTIALSLILFKRELV